MPSRRLHASQNGEPTDERIYHSQYVLITIAASSGVASVSTRAFVDYLIDNEVEQGKKVGSFGTDPLSNTMISY